MRVCFLLFILLQFCATFCGTFWAVSVEPAKNPSKSEKEDRTVVGPIFISDYAISKWDDKQNYKAVSAHGVEKAAAFTVKHGYVLYKVYGAQRDIENVVKDLYDNNKALMVKGVKPSADNYADIAFTAPEKRSGDSFLINPGRSVKVTVKIDEFVLLAPIAGGVYYREFSIRDVCYSSFSKTTSPVVNAFLADIKQESAIVDADIKSLCLYLLLPVPSNIYQRFADSPVKLTGIIAPLSQDYALKLDANSLSPEDIGPAAVNYVESGGAPDWSVDIFHAQRAELAAGSAGKNTEYSVQIIITNRSYIDKISFETSVGIISSVGKLEICDSSFILSPPREE